MIRAQYTNDSLLYISSGIISTLLGIPIGAYFSSSVICQHLSADDSTVE